MEWDELGQTGTTWRVRVQLADQPGQLASLATRLSERGCNLLAVAVLPVAGDSSDPAGGVVDELVLRAPAALQPGELSAVLETPGTRCIGIAKSSVADLVDAQTAVLRTAAGVLAGAATSYGALCQVLGADAVEMVVHGTDGGEPGSVRLDAGGHHASITMPTGEQVLATREWAPFTDGELARVPALLALLGLAVRLPTLDGPDTPPRAPEPATPSPSARRAPTPRRQLSSLDAQFLNAETATTLTHVGGVAILDPAGVPGGRVTLEKLRDLIGSRLHLVAPLRWRLHEVPLGLDLPYWLDVGSVDLQQHIREVHLPAPGTDEQLGEQIARLAETPLDRERPLWECYLVSGLTGGRQALYTKVHHAVIDGVSAAEVLAVVCDLEPWPRQVGPPGPAVHPEAAPGALEMAYRGARRLTNLPMHLARRGPAMLPHLLDLPGAASTPGAGLLGALAGRLAGLSGRSPTLPHRAPVAPMTPFNGAITAQRAYAFTALSLDEVKAVKNALGFTVNDVVMALTTTALRRWLSDHGGLPGRPLVASIPVSVRTQEQIGTAGNQISFMLTALPTDVADPALRLRLLHTSLAAAKRRFQATPERLLHDCSAALPQAWHGAAVRTLLRIATRGGPPFNLFVSNVAGPQVPLYAAGARITGNFPVSVVSDIGGGINLTVMSYDGHLDFGILACRDMVPDVWDIAGNLHDALTELTALSQPTALTERIAPTELVESAQLGELTELSAG